MKHIVVSVLNRWTIGKDGPGRANRRQPGPLSDQPAVQDLGGVSRVTLWKYCDMGGKVKTEAFMPVWIRPQMLP
jgi:hypothetical protein